ncbi:MAG: stage II sporulation protein R [Clostridia bacterium]|nr:stage II sporulation protein R [Clostridia bacterium]
MKKASDFLTAWNHFVHRLAAFKLLRLELAMAAGLAIVLTYTTAASAAEQREIAARVLRLHVVAQSDSAEDQALKLVVRDRLLELSGAELAGFQNAAEAKAWAEARLPELCAAAEEELAENGCPLPVTARICTETFPARTYGSITLPAGEYTALRVTIGAGEGQNWWCVMFPPFCTSAAADTTVFTDGQWRTMTAQTPDVAVRFKLLEWWQALKSLF